MIQNLCEMAATQISMFIKPFLRTSPISIPAGIKQCYDVNITTRTFYNADLVILVNAYADPKDKVYANASNENALHFSFLSFLYFLPFFVS